MAYILCHTWFETFRMSKCGFDVCVWCVYEDHFKNQLRYEMAKGDTRWKGKEMKTRKQ